MTARAIPALIASRGGVSTSRAKWYREDREVLRVQAVQIVEAVQTVSEDSDGSHFGIARMLQLSHNETSPGALARKENLSRTCCPLRSLREVIICPILVIRPTVCFYRAKNAMPAERQVRGRRPERKTDCCRKRPQVVEGLERGGGDDEALFLRPLTLCS
jgi:hypothetical protein